MIMSGEVCACMNIVIRVGLEGARVTGTQPSVLSDHEYHYWPILWNLCMCEVLPVQ